MGKKIKFKIAVTEVFDVYINTDDYKHSPYDGIPPEMNWDDTPRVSWSDIAHKAWENGVPWESVYVDWDLFEYDEVSDEEYELWGKPSYPTVVIDPKYTKLKKEQK